MDPVTFMWFISTYFVPENNFYFEHSSKYGSWAANFTKKSNIFHPVWDPSGFTRRGDHPPHPPVDPSLPPAPGLCRLLAREKILYRMLVDDVIEIFRNYFS